MVNIIKGRSGTGKTSKLLEYADTGSDNLIVTTDPSVFYIESVMAKKSMPCMATGHRNMAKKVLEILGVPYGREVKREVLTAIVAKIMKEESESLTAFAGTGFGNGATDHVLSFISECRQHRISTEDFAGIVKNTSGSTREKFHDIAVVYGRLSEYMEERGLASTEDIMDSAVRAVRECKKFPIKNVLVDSAEEYQPIYRELLGELAVKTENFTIAFSSTSPKAYDYEICRESMDTAAWLADYAMKAGCPVNIHDLKRKKDDTSGIRIIEKELFNRGTETVSSSDAVRLHEASSLYKETDYVVSQIKELVRERGAKPEDIIVTSSDVGRYINIISSAFAKNGINFFYYRESRVSKTYLYSFIRTALETALDTESVKNILALAQFSYIGISRDEFSTMDAFFTRFGRIMEIAMKNGEKYDLENFAVVNMTMDRILGNVIELKKALGEAETAAGIMGAIMKYLEAENVQAQVVETYNNFIRSEKMQEAERLKASWNRMMEIFDSISEIFGGDRMNTAEFMEIMEQMADRAVINVTQQFYGQVSVMDLRQAQNRKSKYLFVIGCNEGHFPENPPRPFITDHEKGIIKFRLKTDLPTSGRMDTLNRAMVYSALTMPSERLYVSWSLNDTDSKPMAPASILSNVIKTFAGNMAAEQDFYDTDKEEAFIRLLEDMSEYRATGNKPADLDGRYMDFISDPKYSERLFHATASATVDRGMVNAGGVTDVYGEKDFFGVTRLEKFGQCPFKHFVDYGMRPSRIKIFDETATDRGNYFHEVMKEFFATAGGKSIKEMTREEFEEIIDPVIDKLAEKHNDGIFQTVSRFMYEAEKLKMRIKTSAWQAVKQIQAGKYTAKKGEYAVGREIPLDITLPSGKTVHIVGVIDRIDTSDGFIRVIDYKSGNVDFSEELLQGGVQLQLPLYSKAVSGESEFTPGGMYYFHIQDPVIDVDNPNDSIEKRFQMSGPTLDDPDAVTAADMQLVDGGYSSCVVSVSRTSKGALSARSKVLGEEGFEKVMEQAADRAGENAEGILSGETRAYPFVHKQTNACDYCKYRSICHFDPTEKNSQRRLSAELDKEG